ncbi:hypothetical protein [Ilumatobacter sp.]|uniref:baeRF3 domain-containing protein n=1 Tax=Ilumatobacter sp. TaxID=1967498 RepID=UPI0037534636
MNRATLNELQRQRSYPSITMLLNTTPGITLSLTELDTARRLACHIDNRLDGDVSDALRLSLITRLTHAIDEQAGEPSSHALALFVSPEYSAAVRLARSIEERVTIDDTFTTRDLVAVFNRTALYRVITISEQTSRLFIGDRQRLVEQRDDAWPLTRNDEHTPTWARDLSDRLRTEHATDPLPVVVAGVQRSVRKFAPTLTETIGVIAGNHDRTSITELHHAAWPIVNDWLRTDATRAICQLDLARSNKRYAGGIHEIWPLTLDGRVATLIVESDYTLPACIDHNNQLHPANDPDHPDVNDDIIDDTIEAVLQHGGASVIVNSNSNTLIDRQRIAAILRY